LELKEKRGREWREGRGGAKSAPETLKEKEVKAKKGGGGGIRYHPHEEAKSLLARGRVRGHGRGGKEFAFKMD